MKTKELLEQLKSINQEKVLASKKNPTDTVTVAELFNVAEIEF